jgi:hypothetical protein
MKCAPLVLAASLATISASSARAQTSVELPPFGPVTVVDEVDLAQPDPGHAFRDVPAGSSRVQTLLGQPCRVIEPRDDQASYLTVRMGQQKSLRPGAAYVLEVEYPEDTPRAWLVRNSGNESTRGFHTGTTVGDALHSKYVGGNPESLRLPLSGRIERWTQLFHLHDRFPTLDLPRGEGPRPLTPDTGFDVAIGQFLRRDDPTSAGLAVSRIRLLEVTQPDSLTLPIVYPPDSLPRRHITWREEMADGVIQDHDPTRRGLTNRLDWYRHKVAQMQFLGIPTFSKDLLEFGACQHWDPTPGGGNAWVHFDADSKDLWGQIVDLFGSNHLSLIPYYEYAGSRGDKGLGYERRAKPLTRDDAYTHISWIENANADVTDPDTLADLDRMLDITVVAFKDRARFDGVWMRPRSQWPISFADAARKRFADEANGGTAVTRDQLKADPKLLDRYMAWWLGKRRAFLVGIQNHLKSRGLPSAMVWFTADASEPGPGFPTWERRIVTDDQAAWSQILEQPRHILDNRPVVPIGLDRVASEGLYLGALTSPPLDWGGWEVGHASPAADPPFANLPPGILVSHAFNRAYTVSSPATFDAFRGADGRLLAVRHHALNEHMMADASDAPIWGYLVADIERAGPACMMAEALAVANGDPTELAYLLGGPMSRGFPDVVRRFHAHFLALPALPSRRLEPSAASDPAVVVRIIDAGPAGTYLAVVNTAAKPAPGVTIPVGSGPSRVTEPATGTIRPVSSGRVTLDLAPFELRTLRVERP